MLKLLKQKKKSFQSLEGNFLSCLSTLFFVEEFKIYEDFLQLSDLVETKRVFVDRKELSTNGKVKFFFITQVNFRLDKLEK